MAAIDRDTINVRLASRPEGRVYFCATWTDGLTGENKGEFCSEWADIAELQTFLGQQGWTEILRAILAPVFDSATGAFDSAGFEAMTGNSYRVSQKVQKV